jgi:hypothetical protein
VKPLTFTRTRGPACAVESAQPLELTPLGRLALRMLGELDLDLDSARECVDAAGGPDGEASEGP